MIAFLILFLFVALVYWICMSMSKSSRRCSSGSCGTCQRCKAEQFRFRRHKAGCQCNLCEGFRFREQDKSKYPSYPKREVNMTTAMPRDLASVASYNNGLHFYFDAYGSDLSMGPGQGDPGAVAPHAQYTDLYEAGQTLHNQFGPFQTSYDYRIGGVTSDLNMAVEEVNKLQQELESTK